ncbi:uncharacterized protein I206_100758 [Kwoniella pini CBS 10737]|uniref:Uncharacterized protein n=1 Tax=Kwoniella pini CBS 10737 TaxID=1296096 RepID=A0A1B9IC84_9TREE|nr:uncharacterized protein I206_00569 [Kwoniella pini CBS 10737]OCF53268.1 hypothetical protein I206_00569 [Kwoniella pini CBS 10737]
MRFTLFTILAILPGILAIPIKLANRDALSDNIASSVSTTNELGTELQSIINRIKSDPLLVGEEYEDNSETTKYNILDGIESAFKIAIDSTESLPSNLITSTNPTSELLSDYGPLIKALTNSIFYSLIDLKLLSQDTIGQEIPGFKDWTNASDQQTYEFVKSLNVKYQGLINDLANTVGEDTTLGKGLKSLGGQTFYLLFDHIYPS